LIEEANSIDEFIPDIFIGLIYNKTKKEYYFRKITNKLVNKNTPFSANNKYKILSNKFKAPGQFWNSLTL